MAGALKPGAGSFFPQRANLLGSGGAEVVRKLREPRRVEAVLSPDLQARV